MKKSRLVLLYVAFIILMNLAFIGYFVVKSGVLTAILGILAAVALVAAVIYHIRYSIALKKQAKRRQEYAKQAASQWKPKEK